VAISLPLICLLFVLIMLSLIHGGNLYLYSIADGSSGDTAKQGTQESQTRVWTWNVQRSVRPVHKNL